MAEILSMVRARRITPEQLKNLRETMGLTQKELAVILGVTPLTIIRSEKPKEKGGKGVSRMLQSFIDQALRAGELSLSGSSGALAVSEPHAEYGEKVQKKPRRKAPRKKPPSP
jgi:transcriptional regulator with XRE-family HTH domain